MNSYDAIVIGAGPAGSTAAMLLARAGWSVAIVEKAEFPRRKVCGEFISAAALSLLARSGVTDGVLTEAGPEVREVAVYAGERVMAAPMPKGGDAFQYGRALGRDRLDTALLQAAREAHATVYQPWRVEHFERHADRYLCSIASPSRDGMQALTAPIVIAAHGSWDTGRLPPPRARRTPHASDLLAFKAHFRRAALPVGRMPLLAFPGGYGGLVHSDGARVSFSCCIRRDALSACRSSSPHASAGAAVLAHVLKSCRGAREALGSAERDGPWLAAGPLRPGICEICGEGYFAVGNALGEAHPIVAEGISMAIQSAWLLCDRLIDAGRVPPSAGWNRISREYEAAYRSNFAPRMRAAWAFAQLAMRPHAAAAVSGMLATVPGLLALGARCAGKARPLRTTA